MTAVAALALALGFGCGSKSSGGPSETGGSGGSTGAGGTTSQGGSGGEAACTIPGQSHHNGGPCACSDDTPMACPTVGCIDPKTDNDHCGGCDTKCSGASQCVNGKCGPTPTTVVPAPASGCTQVRLALSGSTLYWTDTGNGTVKSIGTAAGATATTIASTQMKPTLLSVVGTTLFWLDTGSKTLMKATLPTGTPATVYTSATDINGFVASSDAGTVYFSSGMNISKVAAAGGTPTVVDTQSDGIPMALALEGTTIAFGSQQAQDVDAIYLKDGMTSMCGQPDANGNGQCSNGLRIGRSEGSIFFDTMYLIGGNAYWSHNFDLTMNATQPAAGGKAATEVQITTAANFSPFTSFTITGQTAYFTEDGYVESTPLTAGSTAIVLARNQSSPFSIAADANNIYWATKDCAISSMPVPK
ncbi:MAG TPA: hypothetical protein VHJ20_13735 [Polyangia bacterium]|nr:hypothetical protein [Polyangia bacterium]